MIIKPTGHKHITGFTDSWKYIIKHTTSFSPLGPNCLQGCNVLMLRNQILATKIIERQNYSTNNAWGVSGLSGSIGSGGTSLLPSAGFS
jgi:hypothetical protein